MTLAPIIFLIFALIVFFMAYQLNNSNSILSKGISALMELDEQGSKHESERLELESFAVNSLLENVNISQTVEELSDKIRLDLQAEYGQDFGTVVNCGQGVTIVRASSFQKEVSYNFCKLSEAYGVYKDNPLSISDCLNPEKEAETFIESMQTPYSWGYDLVLKSETEARMKLFVFDEHDFSRIKPFYLNKGEALVFIC